MFAGSSSIRLWDVEKYFPGLTIINRGFGGSQLSDLVRYADRIVIAYKPRIVVVYAGDNDIYGGATSEQVAIRFEQFVRTVRAALPEVRIIFIGIKPSLQRWTVVERMRLANGLIRGFAGHDDNIAFVDVDQAMLGWDGDAAPGALRPRRAAPDGARIRAVVGAAPSASERTMTWNRPSTRLPRCR